MNTIRRLMKKPQAGKLPFEVYHDRIARRARLPHTTIISLHIILIGNPPCLG